MVLLCTYGRLKGAGEGEGEGKGQGEGEGEGKAGVSARARALEGRGARVGARFEGGQGDGPFGRGSRFERWGSNGFGFGFTGSGCASFFWVWVRVRVLVRVGLHCPAPIVMPTGPPPCTWAPHSRDWAGSGETSGLGFGLGLLLARILSRQRLASVRIELVERLASVRIEPQGRGGRRRRRDGRLWSRSHG